MSICPERFLGIFLIMCGQNSLNFGMLICEPPSEVIRFWSRSVDFPHFGPTLTYVNLEKLRFPKGIFLRMHGSNGLKFGIQMYPDHLQK